MKKILVIGVIVVIALWLFSRRDKQPVIETSETPAITVGTETPFETPEVTVIPVVETKPVVPEEKVSEPESVVAEKPVGTTEGLVRTADMKKAQVHYFTKGNLELCARDTVALERALDEKFEFAAVATLVELSKPLPQTFIDQGYASAFEPGTRLMNLRVDREGNATADFNEQLNVNVSRCGKEQRRAQIVDTLKEFANVKNVVVTVGEEVW